MATTNKIKELSNEILNDETQIRLIYEFLEETNIWHNLCRKSILNLNAHIEEEPFDKVSEYYPYEKMTFLFLLYYNFEGTKVLDVHTAFYNSIGVYEKMAEKQGIITDKSEIIDDFKLKICISSIFNGISTDKETWIKLKENYKSFCLAKELGESLSINNLNTKKIKV
jgi:hypothetical protein